MSTVIDTAAIQVTTEDPSASWIGVLLLDDPPAGFRGGCQFYVRDRRGDVIVPPQLAADDVEAEVIAVEALQQLQLHGELVVMHRVGATVFRSKCFVSRNLKPQESAMPATNTNPGKSANRTSRTTAKPAGRKTRVDTAHTNGHTLLGPIAKPTELPLSAIVVTSNHREDFEPTALAELAESIRQFGILQPLLVREMPDDPARFELIAGERRLRAAKIAKRTTVPVALQQLDDADRLLIQFEENERRMALNPIERAKAMAEIIAAKEWKQKQAAKELGCTQSQISNVTRLLRLPANPWQHWIAAGKLSPTGGLRSLIPYADKHPELLQWFVDNHSSDIDEGGFEIDEWMIRKAINACTRPAEKTRLVIEYHKPRPTECHFRINSRDPAEVKALGIETINFGDRTEERCWNVDEFDKRNAEPLAELRKQHTAAKKKREGQKQSYAAEPNEQKSAADAQPNVLDVVTLRNVLTRSLLQSLADSLSPTKHKVGIQKLALYLGCSDAVTTLNTSLTIAFGSRLQARGESCQELKQIGMLNDRSAKDWPALLCEVVRCTLVAEAREQFVAECLDDPSFVVALAALLPVDLLADWQPPRDVLECFSETYLREIGREQLRLPLDDQPADLEGVYDWLESDWPAGWLCEELKELVT